MSHINEALRKAQKDRDAHSLEYTGFLSSRKEEKRIFWRRALLWSSVLLILILLAFTSYSWWDSRGQKTLEPVDKKTLATRPQAGRAATVKPSLPKSRARAKTSQPRTVRRAKDSPQEAAASARGSQQNAARGAKAFYEKARRFHKRGRLQDAKRFYQEALRLEPSYVDALNNLGVIYIGDKEYMAAQRNFEKAARLKPGYVDAHYNLACLHAIKGEATQSLVHLRKAVALDRSARDWARKDTDLENLRGLPEFEAIIGG
ncbi:MAG: tetratricopeptide repeat protein [Desulfobacteraceae bacterium]|nr:tetratricopeptide repeat protein [Desulfobacteraceae bacterium]